MSDFSRQRRWGGPYGATFTGGKFYEETDDKPACLWLMFDLDDGRTLPFKGYFGKSDNKNKAIQEAVEALGFDGPFAEVLEPTEQLKVGTRVKVKPWLRTDGSEHDSVTYVNADDTQTEMAEVSI